MKTQLSPELLKLTVKSPCTESWDGMNGDEKKRFCGKCRLNVHNLSSMTSSEINVLFKLGEKRICGRFYQRADGTIITKDCQAQSGWLKATKVFLVLGGSFIGLLGLFTGVAYANTSKIDASQFIQRTINSIAMIFQKPVNNPIMNNPPLMGDVVGVMYTPVTPVVPPVEPVEQE
ncbi:MAG: hypothetical protein SGI71_06160 [Verrucomicrobiota bacterium]|nr:hypothetical protein [Verrucomicrobiota bacterium]